jgi:CRP-like cAMP-binding protein
MISLVSVLRDNSKTEIGLVGNEGMVGLPAFLGGSFTPNRAIVQIAGNAIKLSADVLKREFDRGRELQRLLLLYTQALLTQVSQISACKSRHGLEQQLARWLLSVQDCVRQDEFRLTHQFISEMLGVRRASVTEIASTFQRAGIIRYSRGQIAILNQAELEATACECYGLIKGEFLRLLGTEQST